MAKKNQENINSKNVNNIINYIQNSMNKLYTNTYFSQVGNKSDLEYVKNNINKSIDDILNINTNTVGVSNISQLYSRLKLKDNKGNISNSLDDIINNGELESTLGLFLDDNKSIREFDEEVDIILKYMSTLKDCIDAKRDNVLSADQFSKDFINVSNDSSNVDDTIFNQRIKEIKEKYNLVELFENMYDNTSKYGECFVYVVPYSNAINKLMNNKQCSNTQYVTNESAELVSNGIITEQVYLNDITNKHNKDDNNPYINLEMNVTGILESYVNEFKIAKNITKRNEDNKNIKFNKSIDFEGIKNKPYIQDGLIDNKNNKYKDIDISGCIIKTLRRDCIKPIYIEDICLGYYYMECEDDEVFNRTSNPNTVLKSFTSVKNTDEKRDMILKTLSSKISSAIDSKFINANQDLKQEIYIMLKHNHMFNDNAHTTLKVTFIPPEDIVHMTFKKDPYTHRGISDLENSIIPARLYVSLYIIYYLGVMTREQDKRVYYVKQNVDTNISKTLLNTINQIKKSNFGIREITSMKSVLNLTGRYNDYLIPMSNSGETPINFEIMQGQSIEIKTELLELLEQMAITSTEIPYEYIQSRKTVDYAVRLSMSSGKFLRKIYKNQSRCETIFTNVLNKIYISEYGDNQNLKVTLPPPSFVNTLNTNTIVQAVNDNVNNIVEMELSDVDDDLVRNIFTMNLKKHYLGGLFDLNNINRIKEKAYMEAKLKRDKEE